MSHSISSLRLGLVVGCLFCLLASATTVPVAGIDPPSTATETAQDSPIEVWNETYGGSGTDVVTALTQTDDGGYLLAGVSGFSGSNPEAWLVKLTRDGSVRWERTYGGPGLDLITDVVVDDDEYVLVGAQGVTLRTGSAWVSRVQRDGRVVWEQTFSRDNFTIANAVTRTGTDKYVVGGATGSLLNGDTDAWAVRLDPSGQAEWNRTYDGDAITDLATAQTGGVVGVGSAAGREDGWLVELTSDGRVSSNRRYGDDTGRFSTIQRTDRGYLLGGVVGSTTDGRGDAWLLKTDEDASRQWSRRYGGDGTDAVASLTTLDGSTVFTGVLGGQNWVGGLSADHGVAWDRTYGTSGFSLDNQIVQPSAITRTTDGGILVAVVSEGGDVTVRKLVSGSTAFDGGLAGIDAGENPRDPDGDGLYEDVNGDGEVSYADAVDVAFVETDELTEVQIAALDFDGDGDLDFDDGIELAFQV